MVDVTTSIIIQQNIEIVSDCASNPDNAPKWYVNIKRVDWETSKPLKVGSRLSFKAEFLGRQLAYVYEIAEYKPGEKLVMRTINGPFPMETTYKWKSINTNETKMTIRNKGNPKGFSIFFTPLMSLMMKRANKKDLQKLKKILESKTNEQQ